MDQEAVGPAVVMVLTPRSNLGPIAIRNPFYLTIAEDNVDLGKRIKRSAKDSKQAYRKAYVAHHKARKDHSKFDRLQADAVNARHKTRDAKHMTDKANQEIKEVKVSQERAIKWAACVEREGEQMLGAADKALDKALKAGQNKALCDH